VHEVWAPSRFSADALSRRLRRPVQVVPHPVALDLATPTDGAAVRARLSIAPEHFLAFGTFSANSSLARKNPFGAIRAFKDAFAGRRDVRLVLRCLHGSEAVMAPLRAAAAEAKGLVTLLERRGSERGGLTENAQLYGACDVYLSLHRSEGFGLTLAEAMGAGRATIATGWSGNLEFMNDEVSRLIPARLVPVVDPQGLYRGGRWAEPDHDAAVAALRTLRDNAGLRARLGSAAAAHVRRVLSGGAAAALLR
jgi:glycosyltransferase involved in cell wall biosynthesis